jgi:hypothetical protein
MAVGRIMILATEPIGIYPSRVRDRRVEPEIWISRLERGHPSML